MICNKCGGELEEDALFCAGCGAEVERAAENEATQAPEAEAARQEAPVIREPQSGATVSMGTWICRYLINLIPCVGTLVFIIMLVIWSTDKKYDETSRNWAKASLIFVGISFVAVIILAAVIGVTAVLGTMRYTPHPTNYTLFDFIY